MIGKQQPVSCQYFDIHPRRDPQTDLLVSEPGLDGSRQDQKLIVSSAALCSQPSRQEEEGSRHFSFASAKTNKFGRCDLSPEQAPADLSPETEMQLDSECGAPVLTFFLASSTSDPPLATPSALRGIGMAVDEGPLA